MTPMLDPYLSDVLALFQDEPRKDLLASEVARLVGGDVDRACKAVLELAQGGWLVAASIRRANGTEDVQARLSLVPPAGESDRRRAAPQSAAGVRDPAAAASRRPATRHAPARTVEQSAAIKIGLFSDGSMHITRGGDAFTLAPDETRVLFEFLDRFSGLAAEGST